MDKRKRNKILLKVLNNLNEDLTPIDNILEACNRKLFDTYLISSYLISIKTIEERNDYLITWDDYRNIICLAIVIDLNDLQ